MDEGRLAGIFTERDVLNRVLVEGRDPDSTPLSEIKRYRWRCQSKLA